MNSTTTTNPAPADLGGYQCVENGEVRQGDLLIFSGERSWAPEASWGKTVQTAERLGFRVYRKIPVARPLDSVHLEAAPSGDRHERIAAKIIDLRDRGALQMYTLPELAHLVRQIH